MSIQATLAAFLATARQAAVEDDRALARIEARHAWANETFKAMIAAQDRVGEAWKRIFRSLPDDLDEAELERLPEPPEQAEVDRLYAQLAAIRDHDRWPRELHWGDI